MARQLHVSGECSVAIDKGDGLKELGISVDGCTIDYTQFEDPVYVDSFGPKMRFDVQYMGHEATVSADLVYYDPDILNTILTLNNQAAGTIDSVGALYQQMSRCHRLLLRSTPSGAGLTTVEPCYSFAKAYLIDNQEVKLGTVRSIWKMKWQCMVAQQVGGSAGAKLYDTTCT